MENNDISKGKIIVNVRAILVHRYNRFGMCQSEGAYSAPVSVSLPDIVLGLSASLAPNPANDNTVLSWTLPVAAAVSVEIRNSLQQVVATPINAQAFSAGANTLPLSVGMLSNGTYSVRITAISASQTVFRAVLPLIILR